MKKTIKEQYLELLNICDKIIIDYCDEKLPKIPKNIYTYYTLNVNYDSIFQKSDMKNEKNILSDVISFEVYDDKYFIEYSGYIFSKNNLNYFKNIFKNNKIDNIHLEDLNDYYNGLLNNTEKYFKTYIRFNYNLKVKMISTDLLNSAYFFTVEEALESFNVIKEIQDFHKNYNMEKCDVCGSMFQKKDGLIFDYKQLSNPNSKYSNRIYDTIEKNICSKSCLNKIKNSQDYEYHI